MAFSFKPLEVVPSIHSLYCMCLCKEPPQWPQFHCLLRHLIPSWNGDKIFEVSSQFLPYLVRVEGYRFKGETLTFTSPPVWSGRHIYLCQKLRFSLDHYRLISKVNIRSCCLLPHSVSICSYTRWRSTLREHIFSVPPHVQPE